MLSLMSGHADALERIDAVLLALGPAQAVDDALRIEQRAYSFQVRSQALNGLGCVDDGLAAAESALASGGLTAAQQGRLLHSMSYSHFQRGDPAAAMPCAKRSLALWQSIGQRRSLARAHGNLGLTAYMLGHIGEGRREMNAALQMAQDMRMHELKRELLLNLAYIDLHEGAPAAALQTLAAAYDSAPGFTQQDHPILILGMQVHAHAHRGELGQALACAEDAHRRATALGGASALADCASMALDLTVDIGDFNFADRLVASLPVRVAGVPNYLRVKLAFNLVHLALARGRLDDAARELAAVRPVAELVQPYDRGYAALRHAELVLARVEASQGADAASAALALLDRWQPETSHVEAVAQMQAARLRAHALQAAGGLDADASLGAAVELACALLADPRTPALAALALRRALMALAPVLPEVGLAQRLRTQQATHVSRMAAELADRPALRVCFVDRWKGVAPRLQR